MIRGVIFDFDNTLYDYTSAHAKALSVLFAALPADAPAIYERITTAIKHSNNYNNNHNKIIYIKQLLEQLHIPLIQLKKYITIYESAFADVFQIYDGVLQLFQYLKSRGGIKIGICSNNNFMAQLNKLESSGLLEYVDVIQTSDECGEAKPHLNMFFNIQHKMGIPFEEMAYVGDSYRDDIEPALQLKMLPFHFVTNCCDGDLDNRVFCNYYTLQTIIANHTIPQTYMEYH